MEYFCATFLLYTSVTIGIFFHHNVVLKGNSQNYENQNVENQKELRKKTFDVLIFCDAIGKIRTSKCSFLPKTFSTF